jgi:hypothetical protein
MRPIARISLIRTIAASLLPLFFGCTTGRAQSGCLPEPTEVDYIPPVFDPGTNLQSFVGVTIPLYKSVNYTILWPDGVATNGGTLNGTGQEGYTADCGGCNYVYIIEGAAPVQCWPQFNSPTQMSGEWIQSENNQVAQFFEAACEDSGEYAPCNREYPAVVTCIQTGSTWTNSVHQCAPGTNNNGCYSDADCPDGWGCNCSQICAPLGVIGAGCSCDSDCTGGLVCDGGQCGCAGDPCNDPSCPGYNTCDCGGDCADPSCPGYDICECDGPCADPSCDPNYNCDCGIYDCGSGSDGGGGGSSSDCPSLYAGFNCFWLYGC